MKGRTQQNVIVYNQQAIDQWDRESKKIPGLILEQEGLIQKNQAVVNQLEPSLNQLNHQKINLNLSIVAITASITAEELRIRREREHHHGQEGLLHAVGDIIESVQLINLKSQLALLVAERTRVGIEYDALLKQIREHQRQVQAAYSQKSALEQRSTELERLKAEASLFLKNLANNPMRECERLGAYMIKALDDYDDDHAANQYILIRACLLNIEEKINKITRPATVPDTKEWQLIYAQLCGFVSSMLIQVCDHDKQFADVLLGILNEAHIAPNGDLPDGMSLQHSCQQAFVNFKNQHSESMALYHDNANLNNIKQIEEAAYVSAVNTLNTAIQTDPKNPINQAADAMMRLIEEERKKSIHSGDKFYTKVLKRAHALTLLDMTNPDLPDFCDKFIKLSMQASGQPSFRKKLAGCVIALTGMALLSASIYFALVSFGALAPLAGVTISLANQILFSAMTVADFAITASGIGLFADGKRKGLSKAMHVYKEKICATERPRLMN